MYQCHKVKKNHTKERQCLRKIDNIFIFVYLDNELFLAEWLTDERRLRLISSRDHCQGFSPLLIFDMPRAGFEPAQNLSSDFAE